MQHLAPPPYLFKQRKTTIMRKTMGAILTLFGLLLGASTRTDLWAGSGVIMFIVALCISITMMGAGISIWKGED